MSPKPMSFTRAVRTQAKLKILVTGPSGSGKTFGSLHVAHRLAPGKVAVIDSENGRSNYYADTLPFDSLIIEDHHPDSYIAAMELAVESGYAVVIVDSLSHAWQDVLSRKEAYDRANPRSNSYTNWRLFSAEWDTLIRAILELPAHVIATARSKQAYEQAEVDGKKKVLKLGLQPTIREGTEYEFALHFDLNEQHKLDVKKDNTQRFGDDKRLWDLTDGSVADELQAWLDGGVADAPSEEQLAAFRDVIASEVFDDEERERALAAFTKASRSKAVKLLAQTTAARDRREQELEEAAKRVAAEGRGA